MDEERVSSPETLWDSDDPDAWQAALERYPSVVAALPNHRLVDLDRWYREELPRLVASRDPRSITRDELIELTEWKMKRGVWRPRNLQLVRSNASEEVEAISRVALAQIPDPRRPVETLMRLKGVGPATASAVLAAAAPEVYPFFDEVVAVQVPGLGDVDFRLPAYLRYAAALRERARQLGNGWTPELVSRALWAFTSDPNRRGASDRRSGKQPRSESTTGES